jgi:hypothetical protein
LSIKWPEVITKQDIELLATLKALVDQKPIGTGAQFKSSLVKSADILRSWDTLDNGANMAVVGEEAQSFFGATIEAETLALCAEHVFIVDFEETRQRIERAAIGESVELSYKTSSPITVSLWDKTLGRFKPANTGRDLIVETHETRMT